MGVFRQAGSPTVSENPHAGCPCLRTPMSENPNELTTVCDPGDVELLVHQQRVAAVAQARRRYHNNNDINNDNTSSRRRGDNDNTVSGGRRESSSRRARPVVQSMSFKFPQITTIGVKCIILLGC